MRILHVNGFSDTERKQKIEDIKKNIRDAILVRKIEDYQKKMYLTDRFDGFRRLQVL